MVMSTIRYRNHWIHCTDEVCRIQRPDLSQVKGRFRTLEGAKKKIRKIAKGRR